MSDVDVSVTVPAATTPTQVGQTTFGQMKLDVAAECGMDKDPEKVALVGRIIGNIIDDLNRRKLWQFMLITAADITTGAGTADYAVPADLWRIYNMRKTNDVDYLITGMRESTLDTIFQSQNAITGYPYIRADFNIYRQGTIRLFPTPDAAYTIKLRYFSLIGKPGDDGAVLDMPMPFQTVPQYGAKARLCALTGNLGGATYWKAEYEQAYREMNMSDENQGDEDLRIMNVEEIGSRWGYMNPSVRPRYFDMY